MQQQAIAFLSLQRFSSVKIMIASPSSFTSIAARADVDESVTLEIFLAPQIGRAVAQDLS